MKMKVFCWFGIHKWEFPFTRNPGTIVDTRRCSRCNKIEGFIHDPVKPVPEEKK